MQILKNKFISEFSIIDFYIADLLNNCNKLLKNNRKYFQSSSNYFKYKKFKEEKEAEINKLFIQEEKFNVFKFSNFNFLRKKNQKINYINIYDFHEIVNFLSKNDEEKIFLSEDEFFSDESSTEIGLLAIIN